jgi:hypothetical protein
MTDRSRDSGAGQGRQPTRSTTSGNPGMPPRWGGRTSGSRSVG